MYFFFFFVICFVRYLFVETWVSNRDPFLNCPIRIARAIRKVSSKKKKSDLHRQHAYNKRRNVSDWDEHKENENRPTLRHKLFWPYIENTPMSLLFVRICSCECKTRRMTRHKSSVETNLLEQGITSLLSEPSCNGWGNVTAYYVSNILLLIFYSNNQECQLHVYYPFNRLRWAVIHVYTGR